jgi:hydrogenase accessory protein HypB
MMFFDITPPGGIIFITFSIRNDGAGESSFSANNADGSRLTQALSAQFCNFKTRDDEIARSLRRRFENQGVFVVSLVSSPGSGKTTFLEKTLTILKQQYRPAALVGDLATDNDAARLARSLAPVKQITTGTLCHLEAAMVEHAIDHWTLADVDFLFIENVGNLVFYPSQREKTSP